jgi:PKD repeat protein
LWSFGDGTTSVEADPTKTYAAPGAYAVSLTVTDSDSASATATKTITVYHPCAAGTRGCPTR